MQENFTCFINLAIHKPIIQKANKKAFKSFNEAFLRYLLRAQHKFKWLYVASKIFPNKSTASISYQSLIIYFYRQQHWQKQLLKIPH